MHFLQMGSKRFSLLLRQALGLLLPLKFREIVSKKNEVFDVLLKDELVYYLVAFGGSLGSGR